MVKRFRMPLISAFILLHFSTLPVHAAGLFFIGMQKDVAGRIGGLNQVISVAVSPDGKNVYTAGYRGDALSVFRSAPDTGQLAYVETIKNGINGVAGLRCAYCVTVSPEGRHVYAAGAGDDAIAVFRRDLIDGRLSYIASYRDGVDGIDGLDYAYCVTVTPDGRHVYAAGAGDDALVVFQRDALTGKLTWTETHKDGRNGVDGLDCVSWATVSPDGRHVYTAAFDDNAVGIFGRDPDTGHLDYITMKKDGIDGVVGLFSVASVAVSPDGRHVYAAGSGDDAVVVFRRDASTGKLAYADTLKNGIGGVHGIHYVVSVVLDPDGRYLYAAGYGDDAIAVFRRDPATGKLAFVEAKKMVADGLEQGDHPSAIAVSPNGKSVYAAGYEQGTLVVLGVKQ